MAKHSDEAAVTGIEVVSLSGGRDIIVLDATAEMVKNCIQYAIAAVQGTVDPSLDKNSEVQHPNTDEKRRGLWSQDTIWEASSKSRFRGLRAASRNGNNQSHPRARALALCLAAATAHPSEFDFANAESCLGKEPFLIFKRFIDYVNHARASNAVQTSDDESCSEAMPSRRRSHSRSRRKTRSQSRRRGQRRKHRKDGSSSGRSRSRGERSERRPRGRKMSAGSAASSSRPEARAPEALRSYKEAQEPEPVEAKEGLRVQNKHGRLGKCVKVEPFTVIFDNDPGKEMERPITNFYIEGGEWIPLKKPEAKKPSDDVIEATVQKALLEANFWTECTTSDGHPVFYNKVTKETRDDLTEDYEQLRRDHDALVSELDATDLEVRKEKARADRAEDAGKEAMVQVVRLKRERDEARAAESEAKTDLQEAKRVRDNLSMLSLQQRQELNQAKDAQAAAAEDAERLQLQVDQLQHENHRLEKRVKRLQAVADAAVAANAAPSDDERQEPAEGVEEAIGDGECEEEEHEYEGNLQSDNELFEDEQPPVCIEDQEAGITSPELGILTPQIQDYLSTHVQAPAEATAALQDLDGRDPEGDTAVHVKEEEHEAVTVKSEAEKDLAAAENVEKEAKEKESEDQELHQRFARLQEKRGRLSASGATAASEEKRGSNSRCEAIISTSQDRQLALWSEVKEKTERRSQDDWAPGHLSKSAAAVESAAATGARNSADPKPPKVVADNAAELFRRERCQPQGLRQRPDLPAGSSETVFEYAKTAEASAVPAERVSPVVSKKMAGSHSSARSGSGSEQPKASRRSRSRVCTRKRRGCRAARSASRKSKSSSSSSSSSSASAPRKVNRSRVGPPPNRRRRSKPPSSSSRASSSSDSRRSPSRGGRRRSRSSSRGRRRR